MKQEELVLTTMQKNFGMITTKEAEELGIFRKTLVRMVTKKLIERVKRGLYVLPNCWGDEYYNLVYSSNYAIFSHATALYLLGFSERVPLSYDITVPFGYHASLQNNKDVSLYYVNKELFNLGKISVDSPQGKSIFVYDIERCLCDMVKDINNQDIEIIRYAFKTYFLSSSKNFVKLREYAKKLNVEGEINKYIEILM